MKQCPVCQRTYTDETMNYCLDDGAGLAAAALRGEEATAIFTATQATAGQQDIRFCETGDGLRIAYSVTGKGPLLVRVLGHFTHLEKEWEWPDMRHFWERLAERFTVVRYDGRGIGLSDKYAGDFTEETRQLDLEAVLKAVNADRPALLGISEGGWTAARYAVDHPDGVSSLILYGAYARGARARPDFDAEEDEALITLVRKGWGRDTPVFRQVFTSHFFREDADAGLIAHFNELQRASADGDTAARYQAAAHQRGDATEMFSRVDVPTLVIHCQNDLAVPADEGRLLAATVPAERYPLFSRRQRHHRKSRICNRTFRIRRLNIMRRKQKAPSSDEAFCNYHGSDRASIVSRNYSGGLKADHATEEGAVLPHPYKVVVVAPEFNGLKFISAHHAEVTRRENLYAALGIKDLIALKNDPAESVKDRHLRDGMGFEIVA